MRLIITILLLWVMESDAQIINASPFYEPPSPTFTGILDSVTSATIALSNRRLLSTYTGSAYRVRRSSDNTEQDIGFLSNGDLDTASLKTFVGSNSGFVTKWYDQSGSGNDVSQTTSGNQPRVVNAGTIERQNGLPCVRFLSASSTRLLSANVLFNGGIMTSIAAVGTFTSAVQYFFGNRSASTGWNNYYTTTNTNYGVIHYSATSYSNNYSFGGIQSAGVVSYINRTSNNTLTYYANNNIGTITGTRVYNSSTSVFYVGASGSQLNYTNAPIMEIIIYASDKSADRTTLQNSTNGYFKCY